MITGLKSKLSLKKNELKGKVLDLPNKFEDLSDQVDKIKNDLVIEIKSEDCSLQKEYDAIH